MNKTEHTWMGRCFSRKCCKVVRALSMLETVTGSHFAAVPVVPLAIV